MHIVRLFACMIAAHVGIAAAAAQEVIKIGADLPMSGPNAEYGELFGAAAGLAAEHANADKMLSKKLVIQFEDSQATPQQGVVAMNKLVNVEKVPFVLSAFTGVSKAIAPVGDKAKDHRREPAQAAQGHGHVRSRRRQDGVPAQRLGVDADPDQRGRWRRRRQAGQGRGAWRSS